MKMSIKNGKACISITRYGWRFCYKPKAKVLSSFKKMGNRFLRRVVDKNYICEALEM